MVGGGRGGKDGLWVDDGERFRGRKRRGVPHHRRPQRASEHGKGGGGVMRILETLTSCSFQITLDSCCQGRRLGEGVREWEVKVEGEETDVLL